MELIEYPTRDVYWRDANVFYRARMEYMNDKERIDGVNPTKISLHAFDTSKLPRDIKQFVGMENRLGAQQLFKYEFGYRQLPHQTVKAGNSSGHIYQTGESFHVETHWGQNRHLITSGERDKYVIPAPRETTERIARITIIAAGIMHKRYEAITQAPLLGQRPPQQQ
jgi:DNA-directed RNA polymerase subunit K/omega